MTCNERHPTIPLLACQDETGRFGPHHFCGYGEQGMYRWVDDAIKEREEVEHVFSLGGGELEHEAWTYWSDEQEHSFPHWYEGVPSYAGSDFEANIKLASIT